MLMQMSLGYTVPFLLRTAAQLCLADHLADGARTAANSRRPPTPTRRRSTASCAPSPAIGVFSEDESHRFSLTPLAEPLRSDIPGSVRTSILSITGDSSSSRGRNCSTPVQTGQGAFDKYFGVPFFDHLTINPEEAAMFSDLLIGINSADRPPSRPPTTSPRSHISPTSAEALGTSSPRSSPAIPGRAAPSSICRTARLAPRSSLHPEAWRIA